PGRALGTVHGLGESQSAALQAGGAELIADKLEIGGGCREWIEVHRARSARWNGGREISAAERGRFIGSGVSDWESRGGGHRGDRKRAVEGGWGGSENGDRVADTQPMGDRGRHCSYVRGPSQAGDTMLVGDGVSRIPQGIMRGDSIIVGSASGDGCILATADVGRSGNRDVDRAGE